METYQAPPEHYHSRQFNLPKTIPLSCQYQRQTQDVGVRRGNRIAYHH